MYSLDQLRVFAAVCESGSFSAAARRLGRAQSGISQAIANLEIDTNQILFARSKNAAALTEHGRALLPVVRAVLQQTDYLDQKLQALGEGNEHHLTLAIEETLWTDEVISLLAGLQQRFPMTNLDLLIEPSANIVRLIAEGQAQLGIVYQNDRVFAAPDSFFLGHARFVTAAARQHPLAQLPEVHLNDLRQHCQLIHCSFGQNEPDFGQTVAQQHWQINSFYLLYELACNGLGWAHIPEKLLEETWLEHSLVRLNVHNEPQGSLIPVVGLIAPSHRRGEVTQYLIAQLQVQWKE